MPNFARVADMVGGLRGAIADYRNNDRQAMQDKLSMVKQFMDIHSQEQRGQLETAQAQEAAMRTSLLPGQLQAELSQQDILRQQQERLLREQVFTEKQAGKAFEAQNRILSNEEKQPYQKYFPEYAQWFEGDVTQAQMDKIVDTIKTLEDIKTKKIKTPDVVDWGAIVDANPELKGTPPTKDGVQTRLDLLKQTSPIEAQKIATDIEERQAYEKVGTTKGAVIADTEISQKKKAEQDVEIAKATVNLRKLQAAVAEANAKRIKEGKSPAEMNPYQKKLQIQLDMVDALVAQGVPELEAFRTVFDSKELTYANVSSMRNEVVRQISALPPDSPERTVLNEKLELYDSILDPTLQRMAGKKTTAGQADKDLGDVSGDTLTVDYNEWMAAPLAKRLSYTKELAKAGIRVIDFTSKGMGVIHTIEIDGDGNVISSKRVGAKTKPATKPTAKLAQKPAVQGSQNPKVQAVIQSLKSKGITSINQLEPDIIQALKAQGIYDQVLKLLGG